MDEFAQTLFDDPRIAAALVFGSAARGELRQDSDLDVAILATDTEAVKSLDRDPLDTLGALAVVAGRDVHLVDLDRAEPALRRVIFDKGQLLFDRSAGRLRELKVRTLLECFDGEYVGRLIDEGHRRRLRSSNG